MFNFLKNLIVFPNITSVWTKQQIFDTVAKHLFTQGVRCDDGDHNCLYRGPNGTKCAVGALIPDAMYNKDMEYNTVDGLFHDFPEVQNILGRSNRDLLTALQYVHDKQDNWGNTYNMKGALRTVAREELLDEAVLDGLSFNGK